MTKAKSRLQSSPAPTSAEPKLITAKQNILGRYTKYLPLLVIGLINWIGLGIIFATISPHQVQNMLVPHLYLPALVLFELGSFFTLAFVLLHSRRALILATLLTTFFFFRLQHIVFTWQLVGSTLIFFGILELSLTLLLSSLKQAASSNKTTRANIKPQTHQPKRD